MGRFQILALVYVGRYNLSCIHLLGKKHAVSFSLSVSAYLENHIFSAISYLSCSCCIQINLYHAAVDCLTSNFLQGIPFCPTFSLVSWRLLLWVMPYA